ncbi:BAI1-associated protein 3-like [Dysidea avara]|uniref:BAI1-associated protein 3-like n=1 Tax=Dysidea avara TaxID=196820 RepID=UPI00332702D3
MATEFFSTAKKKAEEIAEKGLTDVSDAIYATGNVVKRGGSLVTSFLTTSVGEFGNDIYDQWYTKKVQEAPEANENVADIMDTEEQEDQKVRTSARDALDKLYGEGKKMVGMSSKIELGQLDTMLPLNPSIDVWREAQPVTKITDSLYPFGKRPTVNELDQVYKVALGVLLNPVNKDYQKELEPYIIQMFGKSIERHEGLKSTVQLDKMPTEFKLHIMLVGAKTLASRDASDKSDPYCFITIIKSEHVDMISSDKHDVVKINETKHLGLKIEQCKVSQKPQDFVLPLRKGTTSDMILIEVWDSDESSAKSKGKGFGKLGKLLGSDSDGFMGRAFMPLSDVDLTQREKALTICSRSKKKSLGEVMIKVNLVGEKPPVDEAEVLKDHSLLTATVLNFESHMTGEYAVGWNTKITPLGYKLLSLNAGVNGITVLQQASVLFPLLQSYDEHIGLSIIGYYGVVRTIRLHQKTFSGSHEEIEQATKASSEWVQTLLTCLDKLDSVVVDVLRKHHELFSFRTEEEIDYLTLHVELIKEMYTITTPYVEQLEDSKESLKSTLQNACESACTQWFNTLVKMAIPAEPDDKKSLLCFLEVINHIIQRLHNASRVQAVFEGIGIDYYTLMFTVVDKQVSGHVKDYVKEGGTVGGIPTYQLYLHIGDILKLSGKVPHSELQLKDYHDWFKGLVGDWIDVAASKCNLEIKRAVTSLDEVVTVTENVKFSQSALSTAACFKRIAAFWNNLRWPRVSEHYSFIIRVVKNVSKAARFYVEESHKHLIKMRFHFDSSSKEFLVTQQLCISLNDIEYVRKELSRIPETLQFDTMISNLAAVEGKQQGEEALTTLINLINSADDDVKIRINQLISSIGEQISNDITAHLKVIMEIDHKVDLVEAIDPLMQYLVKNMGTIHTSLLVSVLEIMLRKIWYVTVLCFTGVVDAQLGKKTAKRLLGTLKELGAFFHANGDGLPLDVIQSDKFKKIYKILDFQAATDDELIDRHLMCLAEWSRSGDKNNGLLSFSVGYIQNKGTLEITVIQGKNLPVLHSDGMQIFLSSVRTVAEGKDLPAPDPDGFSDPYVCVALMPERRFKTKPVKTDYKGKDLNPTYYKEFNMKIKEDLLDMSGSVLTLTVYNHKYIKRDVFVGMVVIDGTEIPRLSGGSSNIDDPNAPQRKTYELPLVVDTLTPELEELLIRRHQYVNDFTLWHSRESSVAENIKSTITGGLARAFIVKH